MSDPAPPLWLETLLLWSLPTRDKETISGDMLEEYREIQLPRLGPLRANLWYARQVISFLAARGFGGSAIRASLAWVSASTALAGVWLALMENILRHPGYVGRSAIAVCIVIQALATVVFLMWHDRPHFRLLVLAAAAGIAVLGASAVIRILHAPHFEGFVLLIGAALIVQGTLTIVVVGGADPPLSRA